ncbi:M23 family metallopeptidase [Colwelliaceae bacterium MEBiC 14330]
MTTEQDIQQSSSSFRWLYPLLLALTVATGIKIFTTRFINLEWQNTYNWAVYFACYFLSVLLFNKLNNKTANNVEDKHPAYFWPMPGLSGKLGVLAKSFIFVTSNFISLFNPFLFVQQLRLTFGMIRVSARIRGREATIENYKTKASYRLPFRGTWLIYHGGNTQQTSHSWQVLNQRYAYDFVMADSDYKRHKKTGFEVGHYLCYGQDILAAADGEVVKVVCSESKSPLVGWFFINPFSKQAAGNYIVIKHEQNEYGFYAHLVKGSIPLKAGDKVKAGQLIGQCGFTGSTTEPHLHFHLQDSPSFYHSVGLPLRFSAVSINHTKHLNAILFRGSFVANSD